jgi:hypothetical protein
MPSCLQTTLPRGLRRSPSAIVRTEHWAFCCVRSVVANASVRQRSPELDDPSLLARAT